MKTNSTEGKALAITAGGLFAAGTLGILLEDVLLHDAPFTLKHALTLVVVGGTILVGHLASNARQAGHYLAMAGFAVLFLAGTLLTVYSSVGRQAEHTMIASAEVEAAEKARARATKGLAEAETMLAQAQRDLAKECKSGKGRRCEGIKATVDVYEAAAKGHKAELDRLGPVKVAVPEAKRAGELAAVFGADPVKVEAAAVLAVPFLTTLFLELGAIICLGYGFRPVRKVAVNDNAPTAEVEPLPPVRATVPEVKGTNVIAWSKAFEAANGRKPRLDEAELAFKGQPVSRSTIYRRLKAA
jgi:hypothetical protein